VALDVVGVAVEAVLVVADENLRAYLADHVEQQPGRRVQVGLPERARVAVGGGTHHARVAVPAGAAEEPVIRHAECLAGGLQLGQPVPAELVRLGRRELGQRRHVYLALLAERAGDQRDVGAGGGVVGHGRAGTDGLVVRMGVHEHDPPGLADSHRHTLRGKP
jgi:hypothetical protein